jgi:hypothetical protein
MCTSEHTTNSCPKQALYVMYIYISGHNIFVWERIWTILFATCSQCNDDYILSLIYSRIGTTAVLDNGLFSDHMTPEAHTHWLPRAKLGNRDLFRLPQNLIGSILGRPRSRTPVYHDVTDIPTVYRLPSFAIQTFQCVLHSCLQIAPIMRMSVL